MKEGEIQVISNTCSGNVSNYSNYKTMRNGDVVQVERWTQKLGIEEANIKGSRKLEKFLRSL